MEKQLLNSFFIRFDNFTNQKCYNGFITPLECLEIKQAAKIVFTTENINTVFNLPTVKIYSVIKKHI